MPPQTMPNELHRLFGLEQPPELCQDSLRTFLQHIRDSLEHPCFLFVVHEDGASFEALQLQELCEEFTLDQGLLAKVKRPSDDRLFELPLAELECPPEDTANHRLIDAYCQWFVRASFLPHYQGLGCSCSHDDHRT